MKKLLSIGALCALVCIGWITPSEATNAGVCPQGGAWSSHLSANQQTEFTYDPPGDVLIVELCVKAGSANQGNGPEVESFNPGVPSVTFNHSSGKEISHFSVRTVPNTVTTSTTAPSSTSTTVASTTTDPPTTVPSTTAPPQTTSTTVTSTTAPPETTITTAPAPSSTTTVPPTTEPSISVPSTVTVPSVTAPAPRPSRPVTVVTSADSVSELPRTGFSGNMTLLAIGLAIAGGGLVWLADTYRKGVA